MRQNKPTFYIWHVYLCPKLIGQIEFIQDIGIKQGGLHECIEAIRYVRMYLPLDTVRYPFTSYKSVHGLLTELTSSSGQFSRHSAMSRSKSHSVSVAISCNQSEVTDKIMSWWHCYKNNLDLLANWAPTHTFVPCANYMLVSCPDPLGTRLTTCTL